MIEKEMRAKIEARDATVSRTDQSD
jgi:hypothetical protein